MKKILFFLLLISVFFTGKSNAALTPVTATAKVTRAINPPVFSKLSIKDIQQWVGRKLTLKEKLSVKLLQWKMRHSNGKAIDNSSPKGRTAFALGLASLVLLFIPFINILSIPAAIAAIIVGSNARREFPNDTKAKTGIILGIISLALILIAVLLVIAILSSWVL